MAVYVAELRKLSAEFECDADMDVDIPFVVAAVRYGLESSACGGINVEDKQYLINQLCTVLANSVRLMVNRNGI